MTTRSTVSTVGIVAVVDLRDLSGSTGGGGVDEVAVARPDWPAMSDQVTTWQAPGPLLAPSQAAMLAEHPPHGEDPAELVARVSAARRDVLLRVHRHRSGARSAGAARSLPQPNQRCATATTRTMGLIARAWLWSRIRAPLGPGGSRAKRTCDAAGGRRRADRRPAARYEAGERCRGLADDLAASVATSSSSIARPTRTSAPSPDLLVGLKQHAAGERLPSSSGRGRMIRAWCSGLALARECDRD